MVDKLVGSQFGNYHLRRLLGRGSFADVYLGEHIYLKTRAAIKVLRLHLIDEARTSFLREAQTVASLEHPHIIRVLEFGVEQQRPFLVMNYAHHGTLRDRFRRGIVFSPATIAPYLEQIAHALDYAHNHNVIHRDIKPENILLKSEHELLLSDFGLATVTQEGASDRAGTLRYMSPEQIQGEACTASDQYATGVMVYEWLTGHKLFQGTLFEITMQHLYVPPLLMNADISFEVEEVVRRALMKDPKDRFPSMGAFALAFTQAAGSLSDTHSDTEPMAAVKEPLNIASTLPEKKRAFPDAENTPPDTLLQVVPKQEHDTPLPLPPTDAKGSAPLPVGAETPVQDGAVAAQESRYTRRNVLLGAAGLLSIGALGSAFIALFGHQRSSLAHASAQYKPAQSVVSHATPVPKHTPSPRAQKTPHSSLTPTPPPGYPPTTGSSATPGSTATTTQTANPAFNVQFVQYPAELINGQAATIEVRANEPGVHVILNVTYNVPPSKTVTVSQQADSQGYASLSWTVSVSQGKKNIGPMAALLVSANDSQGKNASISLSLPVIR